MKISRYLLIIALFASSIGLAGQPTSNETKSKTLEYDIDIVPGFNLIANQVDIGDNTINEVLPPDSVPFGTTVYLWCTTAWETAVNIGFWMPDVFVLSPGVGFFLYTDEPFTLHFSGLHHDPQPVHLEPNRQYLLACQEPKKAKWKDIVADPPAQGTEVCTWDVSAQSFKKPPYVFIGKKWDPKEPTAAVGEAWLINTPP